MVQAVGILGEQTGWSGLSASQNAMLHAALMRYGVPQPAAAQETQVQAAQKSERVAPVEQVSRPRDVAHQPQQQKTVDGAVMTAIRSAVSSFQSNQNGNFAEILRSKLDDAGIDSSKTVVDYYV